MVLTWEANVVAAGDAAAAADAAETNWKHKVTPDRGDLMMVSLLTHTYVIQPQWVNTTKSSNNHSCKIFRPTRRGWKCVENTGFYLWNLILSNINAHCFIGCFKQSLLSLIKQCALFDLTLWNSSFPVPRRLFAQSSELFAAPKVDCSQLSNTIYIYIWTGNMNANWYHTMSTHFYCEWLVTYSLGITQ